MNPMFWILLAGMLILAWLWLLVPVWRNRALPVVDQAQQNLAIAREQMAELKRQLQNAELNPELYQQQLAELQGNLHQNLLDVVPEQSGTSAKSGRWLALLLLLWLPLMSLGLYSVLGEPEAIQKQTLQQSAINIEQQIPALLEHLQRHPDDGPAWMALGKSYIFIHDYPKASAVFARLYGLQPDNLELLLNYADTLAMTRDGQLSGEPAHLVAKALRLAPDNLETLWLAGLVQAEAGEYQQALQYWQRLLQQLPADHASRAQIQAMIDNSRTRLQATGVKIRVQVQLDPALQASVQPEQTVFIYLQQPDARMPLAVWRKQVSDLPLAVRFDDSVLLQTGQTLQGLNKLTVTARISPSGQPQAQPGDLIGAIKLELSQQDLPVVNVLINHRVD